MSSPNANAKTTAPVITSPDQIRNVVMIGSSGSGKTTIVEGLLLATGAITRAGSVQEGTTVTDFTDEARRTQRSVGMAVAPVMHDGVKINFIDAPGYADYTGDMRAGLRAADAALFFISAVDGVTGTTRMLWDECAKLDKPRAIVITKLDNTRADYDATIEACQTHFGVSALPLYVPLYQAEAEVGAIMDLLAGNIIDRTSGSLTVREPTGDEADDFESNRDALLEAIITESNDETLMEIYLEGGELEPDALKADMRVGIANGVFFPILPMAEPGGIGTAELLSLIVNGFPAPTAAWVPEAKTPNGETRELTADPDGPLLAEVVKTTTDAYLGRVAVVRVFSGTLMPETQVHIAGMTAWPGEEPRVRNENERAGALTSPFGAANRPVESLIAGDIGTVTRLSNAETGDTLSAPSDPLMLETWTQPEPMMPIAVAAARSQDEDKLSSSISRLVSEDPTLRLEQNAETSQLVLWSMGEAHADVTINALKERFGVEVTRIEYKVPFRATLAKKIAVQGRHVKQSGGHGQYAVCELEVEPIAAGSGLDFVDQVVGGVVPRQFIPSVEKGVRAQMENGIGNGYPLVDLRVKLVGGKAHSVDSSDAAFQMAGAIGLKEAWTKAGVTLLEPMLAVEIVVDNEYVGTIMADLSGRRGRVTGTTSDESGNTVVSAEVPEIEMVRYAVDLRSMARGSGTFTRENIGYEPMPSHLADEILKEKEPEKK
jgi:elongation factor G